MNIKKIMRESNQTKKKYEKKSVKYDPDHPKIENKNCFNKINY